jgi:hypothetical protein
LPKLCLHRDTYKNKRLLSFKSLLQNRGLFFEEWSTFLRLEMSGSELLHNNPPLRIRLKVKIILLLRYMPQYFIPCVCALHEQAVHTCYKPNKKFNNTNNLYGACDECIIVRWTNVGKEPIFREGGWEAGQLPKAQYLEQLSPWNACVK